MKLSALLSIYHKENSKYFNIALESIWDKQTLKPDEIVLVKDGALTQELDKVIELWQEKLGKVLKVIALPKNIGTGGAKKVGVENCTGDYIAVVDTDDICTSERFAKQVDFLNKNAEIDAVGTWLSEINNDGEIIKEVVKYPLTNEELFEFFKKRDAIAHPTAMMRKEFLNKIGNYRSELHLAEDTLLWYYGYLNNCKLANIDYIGLLFRRDEGVYYRRANWEKSIGLLKFRLSKINRDLNYGIMADIYAIAYFLMSVSPSFVKKIAYKIFR
ncbi:glycosyltransferase [Pasteurella atlantica]|uniref:glycosyltransferase n=1 Tax=Pasteurellaceae TaxID=712 RepID=UPI002770975F|nr:glycosyltransferase [Pasteurella atlantica]MDP8032887.1 glycosyltransferase [Pasteurella atlantica]MDP8034956.1 glycosyltransferase [Pasteurella atlantica]MDP8036774.1 glycosyltransferase [Pasteurella atlantica]MDP8047253.1 glycosyltransferase [Pasteurella atlantica]MDP8049237.1 glycosyltransferase [Pasteurella atlantica]